MNALSSSSLLLLLLLLLISDNVDGAFIDLFIWYNLQYRMISFNSIIITDFKYVLNMIKYSKWQNNLKKIVTLYLYTWLLSPSKGLGFR